MQTLAVAVGSIDAGIRRPTRRSNHREGDDQEVVSRPDVTERSINSVSMLPRSDNMVLKMTSNPT